MTAADIDKKIAALLQKKILLNAKTADGFKLKVGMKVYSACEMFGLEEHIITDKCEFREKEFFERVDGSYILWYYSETYKNKTKAIENCIGRVKDRVEHWKTTLAAQEKQYDIIVKRFAEGS